MKRVAIVSGTLGLGTALVFGAAAIAAAMFPNGAMVAGQWNGGFAVDRAIAAPAPMPAPGTGPFVVIDDGKDIQGVNEAPATP